MPEIAARSHIEAINPVINEALEQADCTWDDIDAIVVTYAPGLIGSLLVGTLAARTLAITHKKPCTPCIMWRAMCMPTLSPSKKRHWHSPCQNQPQFPMLALIVSGGHSQLVLFRDHGDYELLGQTQDDAVGEAFDKVAKIIGLPYPGGPVLARQR